MLFSDIEGSTATLNRLGERWGEALSAQRAILRSVFEAHLGHEMGTEGDSFFVVFSSARDGVLAALEGQRRLQAYDWPGGVPIRVRMGLHTGEPTRHEDGYIGLDVHRAARIAGTASGGQIVLSEATTRLMGSLGPSVTLRDLGWHRLKDLTEAEHVFDLAVEGLLSQFPPIRSLGTRANLPGASMPLVGRDGELAELQAVLLDRHLRLLTLTGPGGTGKTRLAVGVASAVEREFPAGIFFVELHTSNRAATMWLAIADAVDVVGDAEELPRDRVRRYLADRSALLILDNLEQIPDADHVVGDLLDFAPQVTVLATSRRPLHLVSEYEHAVPPLELPRHTTAVAEAARSGAVELFVRRARMVRASFRLTEQNVEDVVELCRRLDGLPLAIELAAARSKLLTPRALLNRLDHTLGSGMSPADRTERQWTLAATIAWSYDLLTPAEQTVFRRLGVFAASCDLEAIEAVVETGDADPLDTVAHLVDMSLAKVVDGADGEPRIVLLETIRAFARHQLEGAEGDEVRLRHAQWCVERATVVDGMLHSSQQLAALDQISEVDDDVRSALDWCLVAGAAAERIGCGLRLIAAMTHYWYRFGYAAEARGWFERALTVTDGTDSVDLVNTLHGTAILQLQLGDTTSATDRLTRALEMARRLGDRRLEARELNSLGVAHRDAGDVRGARRLANACVQLAREIGNARIESTALSNLVAVLVDARDWPAAVEAGHEAIAVSRALGDEWALVTDESNLTMVLLRADGPQAAYAQIADVAPRAVAMEDTELTIAVLEMLAIVLAELREAPLTAQLLAVADAQRSAASMPRTGPDQRILDESLQLGGVQDDPRWAQAYADGKDLTLEAAIDRALSLRASTMDRVGPDATSTSKG
jgi:predicted ATPase/class 3 adenylate cyclase